MQWTIIDTYTPPVFNGPRTLANFRENVTAAEEPSMKRTFILCSVALASLMSPAWLQAQNSTGTEQAVAALEGRWLEAQKTSNPDLLAPLLADKFVNISTDGTVSDREATLTLVKSGKWSSAEYLDVKVTVFGDTAIARGDFRGRGTDLSGKPLEVNERWTDTWVKMANGKWQCVVSHASPIKL
jgi:ketosteroid isomerase-like protein